MSSGRLTPEMLRHVTSERTVASYRPGFDEAGRVVIMKFVFSDGSSQVVFLPPVVAAHIRDCARDALKRLAIRDVRRRKGDPKPEVEIVQRWYDEQPEFDPTDWDGSYGDTPRMVIGCEFHAHRDAFFLGLQLTEDTFIVVKIPPVIAHFLPKALNMEAVGERFVDLRKAPAASASKQ